MGIKKINIFILQLFLISCYSFSQPTLQWAKRLSGPWIEGGLSINTDNSGNVITIGSFYGTVDFDPGVGTYTLAEAGTSSYYDVYVSKLDATGNFLWAKRWGAGGDDRGYSVAIDASDNLYCLGTFSGTVDFDPGPGTFTLGSPGTQYSFISKLDPAGNLVWAKQFSWSAGISGSSANSLTLDLSGNIYTTGTFNGVVDFDPGPSSFTLTTGFGGNAFISKLDGAGNFIWAKQFTGLASSNSNADAITTDASGNVYTTGDFMGTQDFDPGIGTYTIASGNRDIFISKLDASGNFIWAKNLQSLSFSTGSNEGTSITTDALGNVYTAGNFGNLVDFDPGVGTYTLNTFFSSSEDGFISKLDASGNFVWAKQIGGTNEDHITDIEIDPLGYVYTVGDFRLNADFDPGPGTYTLSSAGASAFSDFFISQLDTYGNFVMAVRAGNNAYDFTSTIDIDPTGTIYITGSFEGTVDFDLGPGSSLMTSVGFSDAFVAKYSQCNVPMQAASIFGLNSICAGATSLNYSVTPVLGATSYSWSLPGGWTGTSTTNIISAIPGSSGIFSVTTTNSCGISPAQTLSVTVNTCTGVKTFEEALGLVVYPNPTTGKTTITYKMNWLEFDIYNTLGEKLQIPKTTGKENVEIDLSTLSDGIYFLKIGSVTRKIIKQ